MFIAYKKALRTERKKLWNAICTTQQETNVGESV